MFIRGHSLFFLKGRFYHFSRTCQVSWTARPASPRDSNASTISWQQVPDFLFFPCFFPCCVWELNTGPSACVASTFPTKPFPTPLHWKFGYSALGVGRDFSQVHALILAFLPARAFFWTVRALCELAFSVQSLGMSWNGAALIIHTAEGKENDLCCKNETLSN